MFGQVMEGLHRLSLPVLLPTRYTDAGPIHAHPPSGSALGRSAHSTHQVE